MSSGTGGSTSGIEPPDLESWFKQAMGHKLTDTVVLEQWWRRQIAVEEEFDFDSLRAQRRLRAEQIHKSFVEECRDLQLLIRQRSGLRGYQCALSLLSSSLWDPLS